MYPSLHVHSERDISGIIDILKSRNFQHVNSSFINKTEIGVEKKKDDQQSNLALKSEKKIVKQKFSIQETFNCFMKSQNIYSKSQLEAWCSNRGKGKDPLYDYVKVRSPEHWFNYGVDCSGDPRKGLRRYYQSKLDGYKSYKQ